MRASSSIIAVLAFAPAANSRSAGRLRTTIRHHHAVEDRRAQTTNDSIRCTWDDKFDVNGNNHFKVCKKLKDEHTVPYTCDGQFAHVCCTVSSIEIPIFEKFGTCFKVGAATKEDIVEEKPPELSMPMSISMSFPSELVEPEQPEPVESMSMSISMPFPAESVEPKPEQPEPDEKPKNDGTADITIKCTWKSTFLTMSHNKSCKKMRNEYSVPYTCDGGKNVCCTKSSIDNPIFDSFGQCKKV